MWSNRSLMTNIPSSALARSDRVGTEELRSGCVDGGICACSMLGGIYVSLWPEDVNQKKPQWCLVTDSGLRLSASKLSVPLIVTWLLWEKILPSVCLSTQSQVHVVYFGPVMRSKVDQPCLVYDQEILTPPSSWFQRSKEMPVRLFGCRPGGWLALAVWHQVWI